MRDLIDDMEKLVTWIFAEAEKAESKHSTDADPHHTIYHAAAKRFNLYSDSGHAPIWLSRVVEGVLRDYNENDMTAKKHDA